MHKELSFRRRVSNLCMSSTTTTTIGDGQQSLKVDG